MEMIICTHRVLVRVKGDCEYRTLALAVKRMSQLPYVHDYFKILCSSFWREENLPKLEFSFKKKGEVAGGKKCSFCRQFCRQNPGPHFRFVESSVPLVSRKKLDPLLLFMWVTTFPFLI